MLPLQEVWVQSPVGELRPGMLSGTVKKIESKKRRTHNFCTEQFLKWQDSSHTELSAVQTGISFSDSSVGKESGCNAGDPSSLPGSGRSIGEGIGYPFQYSWASLVAKLVKNLPIMREFWFLGWEDPLEKAKAAHSSILGWRIPWTV